METLGKNKSFLEIYDYLPLSETTKKELDNCTIESEIADDENQLTLKLICEPFLSQKAFDELQKILNQEDSGLGVVKIDMDGIKNSAVKEQKAHTHKKSFNQEQYKIASNSHILEYISSRGESIKRKGREYCLENEKSLVIDNTKNLFCWHNRDIGGGSIQFMQAYYGMTLVDAVIELSAFKGYSVNYEDIRNLHGDKASYSKFESGVFTLPKANKDNKRVFAYLNQTRGIHAHVINFAIKNGFLYEDERHNCVFVGRNSKDSACYATLRGTYTDKRFIGDVSYSDKAFSPKVHNNDTSNRVYVMESFIDVLSFMTLLKLHDVDFKKFNFISQGCLSDLSLKEYLKDHPKISEICFCFDNDSNGTDHNGKPRNHGKLMAEKRITEFTQLGHKCSMKLPKNKDFNDDLIDFMNEQTTYKVETHDIEP